MENEEKINANDGGYTSRKLWFAIGTSIAIFIGAILSGLWKIFGPHYETMISGLIGVMTIYMGSNVSSRWVTGRHLTEMDYNKQKFGNHSDDDDEEPSSEDKFKGQNETKEV